MTDSCFLSIFAHSLLCMESVKKQFEFHSLIRSECYKLAFAGDRAIVLLVGSGNAVCKMASCGLCVFSGYVGRFTR